MEALSLKKARCKDCYKCVRECPVKAIRVTDHQAQIISSECILCGRCVKVCPQNAKQVRSDYQVVKEWIASGVPVVATLAPSYLAAFPVSGFAPMADAMKRLGFLDVQETAAGAHVVKTEYERMVAAGSQVIVSSCCHSITKLIQKYHPNCLPYYAPVLSPMDTHSRLLKEQYPDAKVVFVGPCLSKKDEVEQYCKEGSTDLAITFEELYEWMLELGVTVDDCPDDSHYRSRFFPEAGGIIKSMNQAEGYRYLVVDGVENCREALNEIAAGRLTNCFVEMSACKGSCVNGPGMPKDCKGILASQVLVEQAADPKKDYDVVCMLPLIKQMKVDLPGLEMPGEAAIAEILAKTGKTKPEDMLNCGACGYSTCREKAIAVYQGKAELEMCLPYMKERAESISDQILEVSPNAIIAVDARFTIQQCNPAAYHLMKIDPSVSMIGHPISEIYDEAELVTVSADGKDIIGEKSYLDRCGYVEKSVIYDAGHEQWLIYLKDINQEEQAAKRAAAIRQDTAEVTDRVITKQMRIVQEIASLLGETTAETKIALTKLKQSIQSEDEPAGK